MVKPPAPSSRRGVFCVSRCSPPPLPPSPSPPPPGTRRGVEANGLRAAPVADPGGGNGRAGGRCRLVRDSRSSSAGRCGLYLAPRGCFFGRVVEVSRRCVVLLLTVQAGFSIGTEKRKEKASPSLPNTPSRPPKKKPSSLPLESAKELLMNLLSHPRGRRRYYTADMQIGPAASVRTSSRCP